MGDSLLLGEADLDVDLALATAVKAAKYDIHPD